MKHFFTILISLGFLGLSAQSDSLGQPALNIDQLESFSQGQDEDASFDYDDLSDRLNQLRRRPLDLNLATSNDLSDFPFLTDLQRNALPEYRSRYGKLVSIFELQAVPGFDVATIKLLLPYVKVDGPGMIGQVGPTLSNNRHQVIMRWSKQLEDKNAYLDPQRYAGSPDHLYFRYRYTRGDRLSAGITAEKDAGEDFFKGSNKKGFDFYSAHLFITNPVKRVKSLALGDYAVTMGQGLLVYQGFASRKSPMSTLVSRSGRPLRAFSSVSEYDFFRGAATVLDLGKNLELLAFASSRKRDANLDIEDGTDDPDAEFATSLQTSGLHRSDNELADRGAIQQNSAGASLKYRSRRLTLGANALYEHLSKPLRRSPAVYNQYYFNGTSLLNLSLDFGYAYKNYYFFGETARSKNGAISTVNGVVAALDRRVDVALVYRNFARDYQALNAKPFAETSTGGLNERGTYLGLQVQPTKRWLLNAYYDQWRHDWPRFQVDAPSQGSEVLGRVTFTQRRKLEAYLQFRSEKKELNHQPDGEKLDQLAVRHNLQARLHLALQLNKAVEWRSRFDIGSSTQAGEKVKGVSLYQELIVSPIGSKFSGSTRFAVFSTGGYDMRFYSYERDVSNAFSIPAYYNRGTRFYMNLGYRLSKQIRIEARYATYFYPNVDFIGTGDEATPGGRKSEVRLQVRGDF